MFGRVCVAAVAAIFVTAVPAHAAMLATWDFSNNTLAPAFDVTNSAALAVSGTSSFTSISGANGVALIVPVQPTPPAVTVSLNTVGYAGLSLSFLGWRGINAYPSDTVQFSTDGFIYFALPPAPNQPLNLPVNQTNAQTFNYAFGSTFDNSPTAFMRIAMGGSAVPSGSNNTFLDNVVISAAGTAAAAPLNIGSNIKLPLLRPPTGIGPAGAVDLNFQQVNSSGGASASFYADLPAAQFGTGAWPPTPVAPSPTANGFQMWELSSTASFTGRVGVILHYDPSLFDPGTDESLLSIQHFNGTQWEYPPTPIFPPTPIVPAGDAAWPPNPIFNGSVQIDTLNNRLYFETTSFSPFALVLAPEPGALSLCAVGFTGIFLRRRRQCQK